MVLLSLTAVSGLAAANGITGNIISSVPKETMSVGGYTISIVAIAGIFLVLALNKKEEEMY
jgi:hypothetical protein